MGNMHENSWARDSVIGESPKFWRLQPLGGWDDYNCSDLSRADLMIDRAAVSQLWSSRRWAGMIGIPTICCE